MVDPVMDKQYDCLVIGSCCLDLICRPVALDQPVGAGVLHRIDPLLITGGGIAINAGVTLARLGLRAGILSYVGNDGWNPVIRDLLVKEGIDDTPLISHPTEATSTTVVMIDQSGERSFYHCVGAPKTIDATFLTDHLDLFSRSKFALFGYYSLMPRVESQPADIFQTIQQVGCRTAMDAAGQGGAMQPLDQMLPFLDVYVPSLAEASHQVGTDDPHQIIKAYRDCGATGLVGVKLGRRGVLLSPQGEETVAIPLVDPPDEVVDTTGAGDSFYAGLLAGLIRGLPVDQAGRLGAAAAACCVTSLGGSTGGRDYSTTAQLAGLS